MKRRPCASPSSTAVRTKATHATPARTPAHSPPRTHRCRAATNPLPLITPRLVQPHATSATRTTNNEGAVRSRAKSGLDPRTRDDATKSGIHMAWRTKKQSTQATGTQRPQNSNDFLRSTGCSTGAARLGCAVDLDIEDGRRDASTCIRQERSRNRAVAPRRAMVSRGTAPLSAMVRRVGRRRTTEIRRWSFTDDDGAAPPAHGVPRCDETRTGCRTRIDSPADDLPC